MQTIKSGVVGFYLGIAALGLAVAGGASTAHAVPVTTPSGLAPGDQYRLAFVTSTSRDATSTDIGVYDDFVNLAATAAGLGSLTWRAIASTEAVTARDHTGTNPISTGVAIYLLDGITLIANNNADLWDGNVQAHFSIHEDGTAVSSAGVTVWTGTTLDGTGGVGPSPIELGTAEPFVGLSNGNDFEWIAIGHSSNIDLRHLYAISDVLTVAAAVPEPGTLLLCGFGVAFFAVARRRTRNMRRR